VRQVLIRTRELIEQGWCRNAWAKDKNGKVVDRMSNKACKFCLGGAFLRARDELNAPFELIDLEKRVLKIWARGTLSFNDAYGRLKQEVIALLDRLINESDSNQS